MPIPFMILKMAKVYVWMKTFAYRKRCHCTSTHVVITLTYTLVGITPTTASELKVILILSTIHFKVLMCLTSFKVFESCMPLNL